MSLVLDQVGYKYPGTATGLDALSLNVHAGELVAIIGPSGSGKSTLLKLISGLTTGHTGSITLNGRDLSDMPVHQRNIGMVFQSYALFPHLNVLDNIAYGLKLRKMPLAQRRRAAQELLEVIGMAEFADRAVAQLSGGQQQRVALARALAIDPSALLLDEPLAALDAGLRGQLRDQIRAIHRRFNSITLLVTHDQEEALTMADRVAVLVQGRLLQFAPPKEIYEHPASRAVAQFVGHSSLFPARVIALNQIDTGFAVLAAATGSRPAGAQVHALIRPEHVDPAPPPVAANRLAGYVGTQRYLGAVYRYDFHVLGTDSLLLAESRTLAGNAIAIPPEHIQLLDH